MASIFFADSDSLERTLQEVAIHLSEVSSNSTFPQKNIIGNCIDQLHDLSLSTSNMNLALFLLDFRNKLSFLYNQIDSGTLDKLVLGDNPHFENLGYGADNLRKIIIDYYRY